MHSFADMQRGVEDDGVSGGFHLVSVRDKCFLYHKRERITYHDSLFETAKIVVKRNVPPKIILKGV